MLPALESCKNLPKQPAKLLVNHGWPVAGPEDDALSFLLKYLDDTKHEIRKAHINSTSGKKKGKGKQQEEQTPITTCVMFYSTTFPATKKRVIEILLAAEFEGTNVTKEVKEKCMAAIRAEIKDKKQAS